MLDKDTDDLKILSCFLADITPGSKLIWVPVYFAESSCQVQAISSAQVNVSGIFETLRTSLVQRSFVRASKGKEGHQCS